MLSPVDILLIELGEKDGRINMGSWERCCEGILVGHILGAEGVIGVFVGLDGIFVDKTKLAGDCDGNCDGCCDGYCDGNRDGNCDGCCDGNCDGYCDGNCDDNCDGKMEGLLLGLRVGKVGW